MATTISIAEDGELPGTPEEVEKLVEYWHSFNLDHYYDAIEEHTFRTQFINLSREDAEAWQQHNRGKDIADDQAVLFKDIQKKLDKAIEEIGGKSGAFVRLSTRSPKDAVDKVPQVHTHMTNQLVHLKESERKDPNAILIAVRRAFFKTMRVHDGGQALNLMLCSSRSVSDIKRALAVLPVDKWKMQLVVREFVDIPVERELRGFVYKGKLTALSQYYSNCFFKNLVNEKDTIQDRVQKFFGEVKGLIEYEDCIIDFAVLDHSVKIVELNPFGDNTGGALFSWKDDIDILTGQKPFEFRINTHRRSDDIINGLLRAWNPVIQKAQKEAEQQKGCVVC